MRENKNRLSTADRIIYAQKKKEFETAKAQEELKKNPLEERPYARTLNLMGREAYLIEYFDGILLENQTFPKIGMIEDVTKAKNFINGYKSEMERIDHAYRYGYLDKIEEEHKSKKTK